MRYKHYSPKQGLIILDPECMGNGSRGQEYRQGIPLIKRVYLYKELSVPEYIIKCVANSVYFVEVNEANIYDLAEDTRGLSNGCKSIEEFIKRVKESNYTGFRNSKHPSMSDVIGLFHSVCIQEERKLK